MEACKIISQRNKPQSKNMSFRSLSVRLASNGAPVTLDAENRSFEVIGATEAPVDVFDYERFEVVPEVLLMDGIEMPKSRKIPLLDSHNRNSSGNVLGSYREMKIDDGQLVGRVFFSSTAEAESAYTKAREGHLTDYSVGYRVIDSQWVPDGERSTIQGRSFVGPVRVTTRWRVKELSICPIGADEAAKARSDNNHKTEKGNEEMDKRLRAYLEKRGLAADATEEQAWAFLSTLDQDQGRVELERERIVAIQAMAQRAGRPDLADEMVRNGTTAETARQRFFDIIMSGIENEGGHGYRRPIDFIEDENDKRAEAVVDGLCLRAGVRLENPAPGARQYRGTSLVDIARECLKAAGVRADGLGRSQIVKMALSQRAAMTGDFPYLLANTANKALRETYEQSPSTYEQWCNITDGSDFKEMSRTQLSEASELDQVPELGKYKYGTFGESKEVFQIYKFGKLFAISREAIINDDLGAFTRVPMAFAMSAKRKINQSAYDILTTNANMADGVALFASGHGNLAASGAAPDTDTLTAGRLAMRTQTGLKDVTLNIVPRSLICPAALETTVDVLLNSLSSTDDYKNAGVKNPFAGKLEPVIESYLDQTSATGWYLAADPLAIDTVEMCFLDGQSGPYLETRDGWTVDGVEYKVRVEFGVKAIDWRGLYHNAGA